MSFAQKIRKLDLVDSDQEDLSSDSTLPLNIEATLASRLASIENLIRTSLGSEIAPVRPLITGLDRLEMLLKQLVEKVEQSPKSSFLDTSKEFKVAEPKFDHDGIPVLPKLDCPNEAGAHFSAVEVQELQQVLVGALRNSALPTLQQRVAELRTQAVTYGMEVLRYTSKCRELGVRSQR